MLILKIYLLICAVIFIISVGLVVYPYIKTALRNRKAVQIDPSFIVISLLALIFIMALSVIPILNIGLIMVAYEVAQET